MQARSPRIVVHGGAGSLDPARHDSARAGCDQAVRAGLAVLAGGGSPLQAVIAAVRVLEDDPQFNAGAGAVLTRDGGVEMDASVMEGTSLRFGGVAAMANVKNAVDVAQAVLEDGEHALLCAEGAWAFARERGFAPCDPAALITERARARLVAEAQRRSQGARPTVDPGTVGACAVDAAGRVAAATSTGGMTYKRIGRIGDTPLCGCGTYADDRGGAASATGEGESILRVTMARSCVASMRAGHTAAEAAWSAVEELGADVSGEGGIICCDREGRIGLAHNSPHMSYGAGALDRDEPRVITGVAIEVGYDLSASLAPGR